MLCSWLVRECCLFTTLRSFFFFKFYLVISYLQFFLKFTNFLTCAFLILTELHDAVFVVGALDETIMLRGMRYHPIDIENSVMRCHKKIAEWYVPMFPCSHVFIINLLLPFSTFNYKKMIYLTFFFTVRCLHGQISWLWLWSWMEMRMKPWI